MGSTMPTVTKRSRVCEKCGYTAHVDHNDPLVCLNTMTEGERQTFEFLYGHAHQFAIWSGTSRDTAEAYAAWYARTNWHTDWSSHNSADYGLPAYLRTLQAR